MNINSNLYQGTLYGSGLGAEKFGLAVFDISTQLLSRESVGTYEIKE